jgi:hypothetical protein
MFMNGNVMSYIARKGAKMVTGVNRVINGRDQITHVLGRYLEPKRALERANNIAQALVLGSDDPADIAFEMLDDLGLNNMAAIAAEVGKAWATGFLRTDHRKRTGSASGHPGPGRPRIASGNRCKSPLS